MAHTAVTVKNITTEEELESFIEAIFKDFKEFETTKIHFDNNLFKIHLKIKGDKYNATITTSVMKYILDIQNCFYKLFQQYTGKEPNKAERQRLEIVATVNSGSSDIVTLLIEQCNVIQEAIKNMTGTQTFATLIAGISVFLLVKIYNRRADSYDKKIAAEAELQKQKLQNERDRELFDTMLESVKILVDGRTRSLKNLAKIDGAAEMEVDDHPITKGELSERIKNLAVTEEEMIATEIGDYKISEITMNFEKSSAKATLINNTTTEVFHNVVIQPKSIIDGSYTILKKAQDKELVTLQLITVRKNNKLVRATFDKLLPYDQSLHKA
ncbi:hypothetical protein [Treponema sp. OMZ 805]|uniref:hypothetical protein n=1 Tax=Treponema sp. OMZ 805 TaxID=2726068 RepID=UPI003D8E4B76